LNNPFGHAQSAALARRVGPGPRGEQVTRAWRLALARDPTDAERAAAVAHLERQAPLLGDAALASLCHVLLNTNEFVYVD
jgi:hypothetical protein